MITALGEGSDGEELGGMPRSGGDGAGLPAASVPATSPEEYNFIEQTRLQQEGAGFLPAHAKWLASTSSTFRCSSSLSTPRT